MFIFEKIFGNRGSSPEGESGSEKREPAFVHTEFKNIEGIWRTNDSYKMERRDDTLPGLSVDFIFDDENISNLLEDFPAPAVVRQIGPTEYSGKAFVTDKNSGTIIEWLTHHKATITNEEDFGEPENKKVA